MNRYQWPWYVGNHGEVIDPVLTSSLLFNSLLAPNHSCVHVPQNAAFLSAVKYAKKSIFIQTPNLNAEPLLPALLEAVRRGVDVTYYVCLGYNDAVNKLTLYLLLDFEIIKTINRINTVNL